MSLAFGDDLLYSSLFSCQVSRSSPNARDIISVDSTYMI